MAGDWIKMGKDLLTHPKVVRMSSALRADRLRTVGGLFAVWCLFDEHSVDGRLHGYTPSAVDDEIGWPGFADLMIGVDWLSWDGNDGLVLPDFSTHNGASAKRRAQETDRKRAERSASQKHPQSGGKPSANDADKKRSREEKRREDISTPLPPSGEQRESADRGKRLPDDWGLEPEGPEGMAADVVQAARDLKAELDVDWGLRRVRFELDNFRDYWHAKAGRTATKTDWLATWRTWLRKAMPAQPAADPVRRDIQAAAARNAQAVPA